MSPAHAERRSALTAALGLADRAGSGTGGVISRGVIIRSHSSVRYLTGFAGSHGTLCGGADGWTLVTDARYETQAARECSDIDVVIDRASFARCCSILGVRGVNEVVVEESLPAVDYLRAVDAFDAVLLDADALAALRAVKSASELGAVEQAGRISAAVLTQWASEIRLGMTEREIARELEARFVAAGADGIAFDSIVAAGENSAIPHHRPTDRPLGAGDLLIVDCGAMVEGYRADMTRTFIVGAEPEAWQREIHEVVLEAHARGIDAVRAGRDAAEVDRIVRERITGRGFGSQFAHGTGHGVGLDIHEWPLLVAGGAGTISAGMALTVEPGVYLAGRGGVRVEDTVVVTDGAPRILTESDRALARVG